MARYDTTRRTAPPKPNCGFMKHLLFLVVGFLLGYAASTFYHLNEVAEWLSTHVFLKNDSKVVLSPEKTAEIPKPKFEFYTLLTQENHSNPAPAEKTAAQSNQNAAATPVSSPEVLAAREVPVSPRDVAQPVSMEITTPSTVTAVAQQEKKTIETALARVSARDSYWVQLASFRRSEDAEKMKARLSLKGIVVTIVPVTQQHLQWFRVVSGPFANKFDAERAKNAIRFDARIEGIVRKMDA